MVPRPPEAGSPPIGVPAAHPSLRSPFRRIVLAAAATALLAAGPAEAIVITEIFYDPGPLDAGEGSLQYVEIHNDSPIVFDLSGASFAEGIRFEFPRDTYLRAREYLAVCADLERFAERFPEAGAVGNFQGRLSRGGERILLVAAGGGTLAEVRYSDRGAWPTAASGTGYSLCLRDPFADPSDPTSWTWSPGPGGTPGAENFPAPYHVDAMVFPESGPDAVWRYRTSWDAEGGRIVPFSDPPSAWRDSDFDDSSWSTGETPIGFNESEIATVLADMWNNYVSFAARRTFSVSPEELEEADSFVLLVRLDDGCVVHLNGVEIGRINLAGDPGTEVPVDAEATATRELRSAAVAIAIPREKMLSGENLLAVQVHNRNLTSNDAGFAPSLFRRRTIVPAPPRRPGVLINEVVIPAPEGRPGALGPAVELFSVAAGTIDLASWRLTRDPGGRGGITFPPGVSIPPGGFLVIEDAALGFAPGLDALGLFLFAPDGDPREAVKVERPSPGTPLPVSRARLPDGAPGWVLSTTPTPGEPNGADIEEELIINEIGYNPLLVDGGGRPLPSSARGEFVEVLNRSERTIALDGYRFDAGIRFAFPPGTAIGPQGYLVVARDPEHIRATYGLAAGMVLGPAPGASPEELETFGRLDDGGELLRLADPLGNAVDEVDYRDGGDWDGLADGGGSTLELIDPRSDNSRALAWGSSDESSRAPWVEVDFEATYQTSLPPLPVEPELHLYLISAGECLVDGISLTTGDPPVEHVQNGSFETATTPWRITGTHVRSFRTTEGAKVGNACLHLVATGAGDNRVNRIEVDLSPAPRPGKVRVRFWARWLRGSNAVHVCGFNNAFGRTVWLPVPPDPGSPGRENGLRARLRAETGSADLGPTIAGVRHEPTVPSDGEEVRVRATIADPDGVAGAAVRYQRDGETEFLSAPLRDDGLDGDERAGDGCYVATIPPHAKGTLVNFTVEATDGNGRTSVYPRKSAEHVLVYIVDDPMRSSVFRYRLVINQRNLNAPVTGLATRLLHSDELVRGSFVFEESKVYYDVGVRYRGSPWNRPPVPRMYRVRFNADRPFLDGTRRINLSRYGIAQNEGTAYHLVERTAIPGAIVPRSPRYHYLALRLNDRPNGTVMAEIRPVDNGYARFNWPLDDDGPAWKVSGKLAFDDAGNLRSNGVDWTQLRTYGAVYPGTDSPENYRYYFNPALRTDEDIFEPLVRLLRTMDRATTPDAAYDAAIREILNVESALRVFAVRSFLADWDTVDIGNGQNAYFYFAPREGRHYLVPWDMDHTFENTGIAIVPPASAHGFGRLISRPAYRRTYAGILKELLESSWSHAHVSAWTSMVSETAQAAFVAPATGLLSFLQTRRAQVTSFIRSGTTVDFDVTTPDPSGAAGPSAPVAGTAPIDVATLLAIVGGGEPQILDPAWSSPPRQPSALPSVWSATVGGLAPGENRVEIVAFDRRGEIVGSRSLRIFDTTGWDPPEIAAVAPAFGAPAGGTAIAIRGVGFSGPLRVLIGGAEAIGTVVVSSEEIRALTPGGTEGPADVEVVRVDGSRAVLSGAFVYSAEALARFVRGDVDGVDGVNGADIMAILGYLFGAKWIDCVDAADVDDDGRVTVSDAIVLLRYLHAGGPPPRDPYPMPGPDPTPDSLGCGRR